MLKLIVLSAPGLRSGVRMMDTVYRTKADISHTSPWLVWYFLLSLCLTCEQVDTFCNKVNWEAFLLACDLC